MRSAAPALEFVKEYIALEIDKLNSKLENTESLYKQHGDCHTRVATLLAKREQLIKVYEKLSPVENK